MNTVSPGEIQTYAPDDFRDEEDSTIMRDQIVIWCMHAQERIECVQKPEV